MATVLKNCPFCNGKARRQSHVYSGNLIEVNSSCITQGIYEKKQWFIVKCNQCGISQPKRKYETREASDEAWNNRI